MNHCAQARRATSSSPFKGERPLLPSVIAYSHQHHSGAWPFFLHPTAQKQESEKRALAKDMRNKITHVRSDGGDVFPNAHSCGLAACHPGADDGIPAFETWE